MTWNTSEVRASAGSVTQPLAAQLSGRPSSPIGAPALERVARRFAAVMPALLIGWSALVDPLINFDLAQGEYFGGVSIEAESKSRGATRLVIPLFLAVAVAMALAARPVVPARLWRVATPAGLLLLLFMVSAAWARAPSNTLTLAIYQVVLCASLFLFVAVAADSRRVLRFVLAMFAVVVAANLVMVVLRPPTEIGHAGIYEHKNVLGAAGAGAFVFALFQLADRAPLVRLVALFTVAGAVVVVAASDSKTSLAFMVAAPLFACVLNVFAGALSLKPAPAAALLALVAVCAVAVGLAVVGADTDDLLLATYGDTTFTGRTEIWLFALDYIRETPWLGQGYRGFWAVEGSPKHGSEIEFIRTIGSGHSGFIDIALSVGLVGVALLLLFILAAFRMAGRMDMRATSRSLLYVSVMVLTIGRNFMESVILWSTFFDNLGFVLVALLACYRERPARRVAPSQR